MSQETYVLLRHRIINKQVVVTRDGAARERIPSDITIDVQDLSSRDLSDARRDPYVVTLAPLMPMRLISPLGNPDEIPVDIQEATWGVDAVKATSSEFTGDGVTVAVLDTGIDACHIAFSGMDLVQRDFTGEGNGDYNGHGTHCAGTIFGKASDRFRYAVSPGVSRALIGKVLDQAGYGASGAICEAIIWAMKKGANIISLSLGIDFPGYVQQLTEDGFPADLATSKALEGYRANTRLFDKLAEFVKVAGFAHSGAVIFAAAGNESKRDLGSNYTITVVPPSAAEDIVAVGALRNSGNAEGPMTVADFSNTGPDIVGPGVDIVSAKSGGGFCRLSGTSMATPHVAGVAALWAEKLLKENHMIDPKMLVARVLGSSASLAHLEALDVGLGLAQAPIC